MRRNVEINGLNPPENTVNDAAHSKQIPLQQVRQGKVRINEGDAW